MSTPLQDLYSLQYEVKELIHDQLRLASLELRLAAQSVVAMIAAAVCAGLLLLMAWAGLMGAVGLSLVRLGLDPALALLTVTGLTSVLALLLGKRIRHWSLRIGFPATLRSLKPRLKPGKPAGGSGADT
jgi:uncharacterized membrane protein YqjE